MSDNTEETIETKPVETKLPNDLINDELSKYSWKAKREFEKLYPCTKPSYVIEVYNKEYLKEQAYIKALMRVAKEKGIEFEPVTEKFTIEYLEIESPEEFWRKWNKFKKLRSYL